MSSTHSANPLACAASLAVIDEMVDRNLSEESARKGVILHHGLAEVREEHPNRVSMVLGRGLLAAVLFRDPETGLPDGLFASRVVERSMRKGVLLVHTGRESIKIGPPLTIEDGAIQEAVQVLGQSIAEVAEEQR